MKILKLIVSIAVSLAAGGIGSLATIPNIPTWYAGLDKPPLLPPNEVFGPVWSILYVLIGIALFLVWTSESHVSKRSAYILFATQLALNTLWSVVFFGLHLPWLAAGVIVLLLISIGITIRLFARHSKIAAWLFVPYLAWVCFATYLNIGVAMLN